MERKSFIVKIAVGGALGIELVPLVHDDRGGPTRAFGSEAAAVLDRLADLSASFGTKLSVEADRAWLALA